MTITDLTNTTWVVPAGWSATAGYGRFKVYYDLSWQYGDLTDYLSGILIGYDGYFDGGFDVDFTDPTSDVIRTHSGGEYLTPANSFTLTFTGGEDVTNTSLISWLEANGECQNPPEPETPTNAVTIEYNGAVIASLKAGQSATLPCKDTLMHTDVVVTVPEGMGAGEAVEEWDGSYTISGGTISFTIAGTSYEAEDGMTWEQWVASDYNTGGYSIGYADGIYGFVVDDGDGVVVNEAMRTEAIINGKAYTTYAAGPA